MRYSAGRPKSATRRLRYFQLGVRSPRSQRLYVSAHTPIVLPTSSALIPRRARSARKFGNIFLYSLHSRTLSVVTVITSDLPNSLVAIPNTTIELGSLSIKLCRYTRNFCGNIRVNRWNERKP
nr:MAG TPA: hypothetical protein [Caudoviricetes sp.]